MVQWEQVLVAWSLGSHISPTPTGASPHPQIIIGYSLPVPGTQTLPESSSLLPHDEDLLGGLG